MALMCMGGQSGIIETSILFNQISQPTMIEKAESLGLRRVSNQ